MLNREKDVAIEAARRAGGLLVDIFEHPRTIETKGASYNLVTEADRRSEELILSLIRKAFPHHAILAEEQDTVPPESEYLWVVDPLDGTTNYAHHYPMFAVSIALWHGGRPILAVIYDPMRKELFQAERGAGAFLNEQPIRVSATASLRQALLGTGFYYERGEPMRRTLRQIEAFFDVPIHCIRRDGSAALDLCYVAAGRYDGFWELTLGPWDYAAGMLVIEEAGGIVTDAAGQPIGLFSRNILAANSMIHKDMLAVLARTE